jgi:hypothetical protein
MTQFQRNETWKHFLVGGNKCYLLMWMENRRGSNLLVFLQVMTDSCAKESFFYSKQNDKIFI